MKNKKYRILSIIIIMFLLIQFVQPLIFNSISIAATQQEVYDVILFWGQSNMTGYCGLYNTDAKAQQKGSNNEAKADPRYNYSDSSSVRNYSQKTGIDEEFLSNSQQMNWVKITQEPNTVFDYVYSTNKLTEITENTKYIGETLKYNKNTKKLEVPSDSTYSIQKSYGTNIIPQFCKTYYQKTGHKVISVLASNGGEKLANFLPSNDSDYGDLNNQMIYEAMVEKYQSAIKYMESQGYTIGNKLWVSFQGEADATYSTSTSEYKRIFVKLKNKLKTDLNITQGAIIETSTLIGKDNYQDVKNVHNAQVQLASENSDIILGSSYAYDRFIPDKTNYNSSNYSNTIYFDSNGNKLDYDKACEIAKYSMCDPGNTIHFTSAALSQIGKETADLLTENVNQSIKSDSKQTLSDQGNSEKIILSDKVEIDASGNMNAILDFFKYYNEDEYIKLKIASTASSSSKNAIIKNTVDFVNNHNLNNKVYYTSSDKELLKLIKNYNANANFNYEVDKWAWNGADSIVAFITSLKNNNNKVSVEIDGSIYKDTIAQTLKYNGIPMIVNVHSVEEVLKLDKSFYKIRILDDKIGSNEKINGYITTLDDNFGNYITSDPLDGINYKVLAKDNCGVMFQTIQNTVNSNVRLYTNDPAKDESLFKFKKVSNLGYMIISKKNSFALSAKDNTNNSKLILAKQNQSDKKQIWKIVHNSNGTVSFVNASTGKAIQPEQDTQKMKYNLIQSTYVKDKRAQCYYIYSDERKITASGIKIYLGNSNTSINTINYSYSAVKKITENNYIKNSENSIYSAVKGKLTTMGLKDGQYTINLVKNNSNSIDNSLINYDIKVKVNIPELPSTDYAVEALTHRGYETAPESTLAAFWMARINGFHYSGADVRFTSDGVPVIIHDSTLTRTARTSTGGTVSSSIQIEKITYAQAKQYDFGLYMNSVWKGQKIPTLEEYIKLCKELGMVTNLHIKPSSNITKTNIQKMVNIINKYNMRNDVYYASEDKKTLNFVKEYDANSNFDFLVLSKWNWDGADSIVSYVESLKSGSNRVEVGLNRDLYKDTIAQTMEYNGIRLTTSANNSSEVLKLDKSVDVIATDTMLPTEIQKYALQRKNNIGSYIKTDPKEGTNYKILAKDNCGVMFQTIQNTVNSNVRLYTNDPAKDESLFTFKKVSNTGYMIISKKNSLALSAKDNVNNSKLILAKQNQNDQKQIWKIVHNSNGTVSFVNASTGKAIQPEQDTQKMKYNLIQSTYNKTKNAQQFFIK